MPKRRAMAELKQQLDLGNAPEVQQAGLPKPGSSLWQLLNVGKQSMPEMQELVKMLPLAPAGQKVPDLHPLVKQVMERIVKGGR